MVTSCLPTGQNNIENKNPQLRPQRGVTVEIWEEDVHSMMCPVPDMQALALPPSLELPFLSSLLREDASFCLYAIPRGGWHDPPIGAAQYDCRQFLMMMIRIDVNSISTVSHFAKEYPTRSLAIIPNICVCNSERKSIFVMPRRLLWCQWAAGWHGSHGSRDLIMWRWRQRKTAQSYSIFYLTHRRRTWPQDGDRRRYWHR